MYVYFFFFSSRRRHTRFSRDWSSDVCSSDLIDGLDDALSAAHDPAKARALFERYREAFSQGYREAYTPIDAVNDIRVIEGLSANRPLSADVHRRTTDEGGPSIGLKIW